MRPDVVHGKKGRRRERMRAKERGKGRLGGRDQKVQIPVYEGSSSPSVGSGGRAVGDEKGTTRSGKVVDGDAGA